MLDMFEFHDPTSLITMLPLVPMLLGGLGLWWASRRFAETMAHHSRVVTTCGLSGRGVARRLLDSLGLAHVSVECTEDTDCYLPSRQQVQLRREHYQSAGVTALAIAAHEVGHAQQFVDGHFAFRFAATVRRVCWGLVAASCLLLILGLTVMPLNVAGAIFVCLGIVSVGLQAAVVVPREIDASRRAKRLVRQSDLIATDDEGAMFDRVLKSAALTYIADMSYRGLGLVGASLALLFVLNLQLHEDKGIGFGYVPPVANGDLDPRIVQALREADRMGAAATYGANGETALPADSLSHESQLPDSLSQPSVPPWLQTPASQALPGDARDASYYDAFAPGTSMPDFQTPGPYVSFNLLLGTLLAEWPGLISMIGIFVALGWVQKNWEAPKQALKRNHQGLSLLNRGKYESAAKQFGKAIKLDPTLAAVYHNRGTAYRELNRIDEALADLDTALRLEPGLVDAMVCRGGIRFERDGHDRAFDDFNEALRLAPECVAALSLRGCVHLIRGETCQAQADFDGALFGDPNEPTANWGRGVIRASEAKYDQADADFTTALSYNPEFSAAWRDRGLARYHTESYDLAIADLDEAIRIDATDAATWNNRGAAWLKLGEYAKARADLQTAIRLEPQMSNPYRLLARLQATSPDAEYRDGSQAVENATRAVELAGSEWPEGLSALAAAYAEVGDFEEAVRWQQKYIDASHADQQDDLRATLESFHAGIPLRELPHRTADLAASSY